MILLTLTCSAGNKKDADTGAFTDGLVVVESGRHSACDFINARVVRICTGSFNAG